MNKLGFIYTAIILLVAAMPASAQAKGFDVSKLSALGQSALEQLHNVKLFALGGVGFVGKKTSGQAALEILVRERAACEAFSHLVGNATPEGSLYALLGLKTLGCDCFKADLERFRQLPDVTTAGSEGMDAKPGYVRRASGCILSSEHRLKVAEKIANNEFRIARASI